MRDTERITERGPPPRNSTDPVVSAPGDIAPLGPSMLCRGLLPARPSPLGSRSEQQVFVALRHHPSPCDGPTPLHLRAPAASDPIRSVMLFVSFGARETARGRVDDESGVGERVEREWRGVERSGVERESQQRGEESRVEERGEEWRRERMEEGREPARELRRPPQSTRDGRQRLPSPRREPREEWRDETRPSGGRRREVEWRRTDSEWGGRTRGERDRE
jgi:hypothetical protein